MNEELRKLAEAAIEARAQAADCLAVEYGDMQRKSMEAHRAFLDCVQPDDIITLTARVAELKAILDQKLPVEVRIAPATVIRAGCPLSIVVASLNVRRAAAMEGK